MCAELIFRLDSRQRKKLHTEKLEEEKKQYTQVIGELEEALQNMRMQEADHMREKGEWMTAQQQINQYIEGLLMEKDELIRVHTLETAELRKKNNILKETVEKLERQPKRSTSSSLPQGYPDFDMDTGTWEDYPMHGLPLGTEQTSASSALVATGKAPDRGAANDHPFSWNAFYMCLLFGAFIASNSASLSARSIPQLSDEYREESANVLQAVLASSPPELSQQTNPSLVNPSAPAPAPRTTITRAEMAQMASGPGTGPSELDNLHNTLAMPTKQQEQDQVFALNPEQYNSLTTYEDPGLGYKPPQPSNLQQALAAMRTNARGQNRPGATSDVYTRSLMWDQVPEKVIHDFRRMVQDYSSGSGKGEAGFGMN